MNFQPFFALGSMIFQPSRPFARRSIGSPNLASFVETPTGIGGLRQPTTSPTDLPDLSVTVAVSFIPLTTPETFSPPFVNENLSPSIVTSPAGVGDAQRHRTSA